MNHPLMRHTPTFSCCFFQLDLKLNSDKGGDTSTYVTNGEWDLIGKNKHKSESGCVQCICLETTGPSLYVYVSNLLCFWDSPSLCVVEVVYNNGRL